VPTTEQIQAQFAAYQAEGRTPAEARQGCRVWTKEQLAEERASTTATTLTIDSTSSLWVTARTIAIGT
jgi:hypothetical protein